MNTKKLDELMKRKNEYRFDVIKLLDDSSQKVGYHFNCPDGIISATLINYLFAELELTYIPIDYPLLKDDIVKEKLINTNWFAIVDLSPFNSNEIEYFFDHHISNTELEIKAKKYVFDPKAPSAASLISNFFAEDLPDFLKELANITEITDTASYKTPPPLELKTNLKEYSWDDKIWFIEDVCKSTYTINEHNELIKLLTGSGLKGLWKEDILNRIKHLRQSRKDAFEIAQQIELKEFIIIIDSPLHYNTAFIAREVMKRGAIGAAYLTVNPNDVKVSLRLSRALPQEIVDKYRVDLVANKMDGGGHKGASGAEVENLEQVMERLIEWTEKKRLKTEIVDLREK